MSRTLSVNHAHYRQFRCFFCAWCGRHETARALRRNTGRRRLRMLAAKTIDAAHLTPEPSPPTLHISEKPTHFRFAGFMVTPFVRWRLQAI